MYPKGHYYSPYSDIEYIRNSYDDENIEYLNEGLDIDVELLKKRLITLSKFRQRINFFENKSTEQCYYHNNVYFRYADAWIYAAIILYLKPKRIIEIGSGFSTALAIDINIKYFDQNIEILTIDPYQDRLRKLVKDKSVNLTIIEQSVIDINIEYFGTLKENDILFIDSSHVLKEGSDLNYILFKILPLIKKGVIIHFHDIYLFNYPKWQLIKGNAWNESYALRAFLTFNNKFEIFFLNKLATTLLENICVENFPELLIGFGGSSIYIKRK